LDFSPTQKQVNLQKKVREFNFKEVLSVAWYYDELDEIPLFILRKAFEQGIQEDLIPGREIGPAPRQ